MARMFDALGSGAKPKTGRKTKKIDVVIEETSNNDDEPFFGSNDYEGPAPGHASAMFGSGDEQFNQSAR